MSGAPTGLLCVDKPAGPTSHDVVARVRRALGLRRVGHAGTLDPFATGLLLIGVGTSTRLLRFLGDTEKRYEGTLELGTATDSLDATGVVTRTVAMRVTHADVQAAALGLTGVLSQVPPMVSAVHHAGRRLHELAREGVVVERTPRRVEVSRFEVAPLEGARYRFVVHCSSGTYVRVLVDDLGRALGGAAHVAALRRTGVGCFEVDDAVGLEDPARLRAALRPPRDMVRGLAAVTVDAERCIALRRGQRAAAPEAPDGDVAVLADDGALLGVAVASGGWLRPSVVLHPGTGDVER